MNDRGEGEDEDRSANKPALLNKEEALELLDRVPYIRTFKAPNNKALLGFYHEALNKSDCLEWIRVIKTVLIRERYGPVAAAESACSAQARDYLHAVLAAALDMPVADMEAFIQQYLARSE